jgi:hypothetical protein
VNTRWVEVAALALALKHDMDEIEAELLSQGCSPALAERLLLFIPSAFAAEHYESEGIPFSAKFLVGGPGRIRERKYADEPVYLEARQLARRWLQEGRPSLVGRVLDWSAEANGIKEARAKGLTPTGSGPVHHGLQHDA